jgi:hypothetical protein
MKWWLQRARGAPKVTLDTMEMAELLQLSRDWDGHKREAAVHELCRRDDPRAIAALLVCCGDWVSQVREAAQKGLRQFLREDCVLHWVAAWPELAFLQRVRRADVSTLLADIERFVALHVDAFELQAQRLAGPNPHRQRWLFGLRLKQELPEAVRAALLRQGVESSDLPLARHALQAVRHLPADQSQTVLETALRSHLPRIRDAAARALLCLPAVDAQTLLRELCFDDSTALRAMAAARLDENGRDDVNARAVAVLDADPAVSPRQQVIALHVLSLLDKPAALGYAAPRLQCASASVRRMARGLRLLAVRAAELDAEMLATLADPSAKVRRLVVELVRRGAPAPAAESLRALGLQHPEWVADILVVMRPTSPWEWLGFALELLGATLPDPALDQRIAQELRLWSTARLFVQPDARQCARLATLWAACATGRQRLRGLVEVGVMEEIDARLHAFKAIKEQPA